MIYRMNPYKSFTEDTLSVTRSGISNVICFKKFFIGKVTSNVKFLQTPSVFY